MIRIDPRSNLIKPLLLSFVGPLIPNQTVTVEFRRALPLSSVLEYRIKFRGEVKKWDIKRNVSPKDVSRLVARLKRGEYGIFVTTSTFSKQTQEEVLIDGYPVKLISGIDLVNMFKHLNLINDNSIKTYWVKNILSGE